MNSISAEGKTAKNGAAADEQLLKEKAERLGVQYRICTRLTGSDHAYH